MKRSATVLTVPLLSLLLAGVFAPYSSEVPSVVPQPRQFQTTAEWLVSFVSRPAPPAASSDICDEEIILPVAPEVRIEVADRLLSD